MKRILITGGSGFLGANFCRLYKDTFEIHAIYHSHEIELDGVSFKKLDITNTEFLQAYITEIQPEAIFHFGALSDPNQCELHPEISEQVNILASENLAEIAANLKIPFLFTSTDLVFDGKSAPYKERDMPAPVSIYGLHKSIAEQSIMDIYPDATICRLPLMYGLSASIDKSYGNSFLQPMLKKLQAGEPLNLFTDEYRSVACAEDVCAGLWLCLDQPGTFFHLGGNERISRYNFGKILCKVFDLDVSLLLKSTQKDVKMPAKRPKDVSLDNQKAKELGWAPGTIAENLEKLKQELK